MPPPHNVERALRPPVWRRVTSSSKPWDCTSLTYRGIYTPYSSEIWHSIKEKLWCYAHYFLNCHLLFFQLHYYVDSWGRYLCLNPLSHPKIFYWNVHQNVHLQNIHPISNFLVFSVGLCCRKNNQSIHLLYTLLLLRRLHLLLKLLINTLFLCFLKKIN